MTTRSECRQRAGEDLEPEVLFVAEPVRATLEDADLVVQPLDEAERDLVLRATVGRDPLPVALNHRGELLVGAQALPLEGRPPVLEEAARPALPAVVPELAERLLEQVGRVQALVGAVVAMLTCPYHARFLRPFPNASDRCQSGFPHPPPPLFTHSLPRRANHASAGRGCRDATAAAAPFGPGPESGSSRPPTAPGPCRVDPSTGPRHPGASPRSAGRGTA